MPYQGSHCRTTGLGVLSACYRIYFFFFLELSPQFFYSENIHWDKNSNPFGEWRYETMVQKINVKAAFSNFS
jgi:hypothetical protein